MASKQSCHGLVVQSFHYQVFVINHENVNNVSFVGLEMGWIVSRLDGYILVWVWSRVRQDERGARSD